MATLLDQFNNGTGYILQFAGQSSPWREALAALREDRTISQQLDTVRAASDQILAPVLPRLTAICAGELDLTDPQIGTNAYASVPGILLAQYGAWLDFPVKTAPVATLGYSQGILAADIVRHSYDTDEATAAGDSDYAAHIFALARLIGAAATEVTREKDAQAREGATCMLAVRGMPLDRIHELAREYGVSVAIINSHTRATLSGNPSNLQKAARAIDADRHQQEAAVNKKLTGTYPLTPSYEFLDVAVPFHSPLLKEAVDLVQAWADECDFSGVPVRELAQEVLDQPLDWEATLGSVIDADHHAQWIVDLGPGSGLRSIMLDLIGGRGISLVAGHTPEAREKMNTEGITWDREADYREYRPTVAILGGKKVLQTRFSRLTGKSPIMLAGMTPTTVEPDIVAAAANAGYWAELAGGGQVTEEVFSKHLAGLKEKLDPGCTAQFNAMYMDRYLWNLQFGTQHIVSRERESGAPFDGVIISAGIPDADEAGDLLHKLRKQGFSYIGFKPGTVDQIRQVLFIARNNADIPILMMVEDGHAGGHHSWEDLDHLLLSTYRQIRAEKNVILCVGGGLGDPHRASMYLCGSWAREYGLPDMPSDAVFIGTTAMTAQEAHTNDDVKDLLVHAPGLSMNEQRGWVGKGRVRGGITSGVSHLMADLYEVENSSSQASRLVLQAADPEFRANHRAEIIEAINTTAKPYFGDLEDMTYEQVVRRFAELTVPFVDSSWSQRFFELLQRVEARLCEKDSGSVKALFATVDDVLDTDAAIDRLLAAYPHAHEIILTAHDVAWFIELCRKYPKPVPFVPAIDESIVKWWGSDGLWQSHDPRYSADQVRIIPGPVSVGAITRKNEPIVDILRRYESQAVADIAEGEASDNAPVIHSRLAHHAEEYVRTAPHIMWHGYLIDNPLRVLENEKQECCTLKKTARGYDCHIALDTLWDGTEASQHAVRTMTIPLTLPSAGVGGVPVVDDDRLGDSMRALLAATAGVGAENIVGDQITQLPPIVKTNKHYPASRAPFGVAEFAFTLRPDLGSLHAGVTARGMDLHLAPIVPSALLGLCWPAIYAALGSATVDDYPVIEGLLNAVHLDHSEELDTDTLPDRGRIEVRSYCASIEESSSGRVVTVHTDLFDHDAYCGSFTERFAIRGRVAGSQTPAEPELAASIAHIMEPTPRALLRTAQVQAPDNMTAFAMVSGDYNPIHTSRRAARVAGLDAPIVHGMWLCAAAQHAVEGIDHDGKHWHIKKWLYRMSGPVDLNDTVDIAVERVGHVPGGELILDIVCKVDGQIVSGATALVAAARTAYVYPGQGIQRQGMALDERASSKVASSIWERADAYTRKELGFSILAVVRDNPTEITAQGTVYRHPKGVLNLTQFTQVALTTVAFAQTERLREAHALIDGGYFAGHSLGEYTALSAYGHMMSLETVLGIVFQRGSTMHNLVPRDALGRSNYQMGALRPNQFGVGDADVAQYVASVAEQSGEFLEIVNYNLAGAQYAVAGTIAGIAALNADASRRAEEAGGKPPFMIIPGIDVPFHSSKLRTGVDDFRNVLDERMPDNVDMDRLEGRYIPNLVARPFELSKEFLQAILDVVPSDRIRDLYDRWDQMDIASERDSIGRLILIELLAWQFASPVRWIETQDYLFAHAGIEQLVEMGVGYAPTLANLAAKTLALPQYVDQHIEVLNAGRDEDKLYHKDKGIKRTSVSHAPTSADSTQSTDSAESAAATPAPASPGSAPAAGSDPASTAAQAARPASDSNASAAQTSSAAPSIPAGDGSPIADVPFDASSALKVLLAYSTKVNLGQITDTDTVETLTNGVSSKRNQLMMDMAGELDVSSIDGGAEAPMAQLYRTVNEAAHTYSPFGSVLSAAIGEHIRRLFGASGVAYEHIAERVSSEWGLGKGWQAWVTAALTLETRSGTSMRGGDLASLPTSASTAQAVDEMIDAAVLKAGEYLGVAVHKLQRAGAGSGAMVDSAALNEFAQRLEGTLADNARDLLRRLGKEEKPAAPVRTDDDLIDAVSAELGGSWPKLVAPAFDSRKIVVLNDRWASAREDVARCSLGQDIHANFAATGEEVARQATYLAQQASDADIQARLQEIATQAADSTPGALSGKIAVVTGVTATSIAGALAGKLLEQGATVIATASHISQQRLLDARMIYRNHARGDSALWLVPANLGSYRDIDAFVSWVGNEQTETVNGAKKLIKPAMVPDLFFPFAAPRVMGMMSDAGPRAENEARIMLWGVERMLTSLSALGSDTCVDHRLHVVLPGSPNRGLFGGDGAYGEVKSAFDAICNKWKVEPWATRTTLVQARIGWVRGTGLMGVNDTLVESAHEHGIKTWSTEEIADELIKLIDPSVQTQALSCPVQADLTGGLGEIDFAALTRDSGECGCSEKEDAATLLALPTPKHIAQPGGAEYFASGTVDPAHTVVIVGVGEVGPWGSTRTRSNAEYGIQADGSVELTAAGVLELAWMMGLLTWHDSPKTGWYDTEDHLVPEEDIYSTYRDIVIARSGIRTISDVGTISDQGTTDMVTVFLDQPISFTVPSEDQARAYYEADPDFTEISDNAEAGTWKVTRRKGARSLVPRRTTISRFVVGELPDGFDPAAWGIPASMLESADKMAAWNLVTAVDAFISAGFSPAELLQAVHPTKVGSTQGTGFGGMQSMRKLFVDRFLHESIPQDILQETLPNVIAAHTMQSYVGGYGSMVQPVAACASAAVSLEEGVDKIALGKADFVVTGAIDDFGVESLEGFGMMNATADSQALEDKGINHRFFSRANDQRRSGFVEAQGGGTVLITRGDIALKMGLPVYAVVGYVQSFADGAHTSIPAPGLGALAAGQGGKDSVLAKNLAALGVAPDDIAVVSKHDTSTQANDPNESQLHMRLAHALGRSEGNPLYVISQKTLTGHSKGGAALFQMAGLTQAFASGIVPANRSLDDVDPALRANDYLVWLREPLDLNSRGPIKAGLVTSLGFGHVSSVIALVHPGAFEASIERTYGAEAAQAWKDQASARLQRGVRHLEQAMIGHDALYTPIEHRRLPENAQEAEAALLLDPNMRLSADGTYHQ